jgi:autophagy-related protein 11
MPRNGQTIFRRTFNFHPTSIVRLSLAELMTVHATEISQIQEPFYVVQDHLAHLQSLYEAQARAIQIAYANLQHHLKPLIDNFQEFARKAEQKLESQEQLIKGSNVDIALLAKMPVHEAFLRKKDREKLEAEGEGKFRTLADFVHLGKMEQVKKDCKAMHGRLNPWRR